MQMGKREMKQEPHLVLLPYPAQGHIKPMLCLAELLCQGGLAVSFINTDHNHRRLSATIEALSDRFPSLHFESISDGFPGDHPRTFDSVNEFNSSLKTVTKQLLRDLLISVRHDRPVTCIISDAVMSFGLAVADELEIPSIVFRTSSACYSWSIYNIPKLLEEGQIPLPDDDLDREVTVIPGMEGIMRCRDLPSVCKSKQIHDPLFQFLLTETRNMSKASALILNTIQELEAPSLSLIRSVFPRTFTIGPLHSHVKSLRSDSIQSSSSTASFWEEDRECMAWLDSQPSRSVIYVSFGSLLRMTIEQLMEFWHGLTNSDKPFLWVLRSDVLIEDKNEFPEELEAGLRGKGCIVSWVPQEEVLAHGSIGGFLTHAGWNSTLEGIVAGVPLICWPQFTDQLVISRWVSEVWRVGFDMKDTCDRLTIEKMVRDLMEHKRKEVTRSMCEVSRMARESVKEGGSSFCNFLKLIDYIRSLG